MKSCISATSMALVVFAFSVLADEVTAKHQVPFKGTFMGSFTATPANPPFIDVLVIGAGNATHLGRFTAAFPHRVNVSMPSTVLGTYTFTAANGDTLLADVVVGPRTLVAPGIFHIVELAKIKGGTGRFAGASGQYVMERLIDQVTLTTIGSFQGFISSGGASKP